MSKQHEHMASLLWDALDSSDRLELFRDVWDDKQNYRDEVERLQNLIFSMCDDMMICNCPSCRAFKDESDRIHRSMITARENEQAGQEK